MFPSQLSLQSEKQEKVTWSQEGTVRELEDHQGVAVDQEISNNQYHVAESIVIEDPGRIFDVSPHAHDRPFNLLNACR